MARLCSLNIRDNDNTFFIERVGNGYCINQISNISGDSKSVDYVSYRTVKQAIDAAELIGLDIAYVA